MIRLLAPVRLPAAISCALMLATPVASMAGIDVAETSVRPGDAIVVQVTDRRVAPDDALRAVFDGQTRAPALFANDSAIEVIIPMLPVGETLLALYQGNTLLGRHTLQILDAAARRLIFSYEGDHITLLQTTRSTSLPTRHVRSDDERLSFDMLNSNGVVVYSGTIINPSRARPEVLVQSNPTGSVLIGRTAPDRNGLFIVDIPTPPNSVTLRIYRVEPDIDLFTADGRSRRTLLTSVEVTP